MTFYLTYLHRIYPYLLNYYLNLTHYFKESRLKPLEHSVHEYIENKLRHLSSNNIVLLLLT